jgi:hypothetical protein
MANTTQTIDKAMQECIDNCTECHRTCVETSAHCLDMGGEHASRMHQTALIDCAQICATSADFMLRQSPMHSLTCAACAEACRRCAEECERLMDGDAVMEQCAETCRRCERSCEQMTHRM